MPTYTVIKQFRDKYNFSIIHLVGEDISDFEQSRLDELVSRGYASDGSTPDPGGSGGLINQTLPEDVTVILNGKKIIFSEPDYPDTFLTIDSTDDAEVVGIQAVNPTNDGNYATFGGRTSDVQSEFVLGAYFNGGVKLVLVRAISNSAGSTAEYSSDTHTFNGNVKIYGTDVDTATNKILYLVSTSYPNGIIKADVDADTRKVRIILGDVSAGGNNTKLQVNDINQTIVHTANAHTFNGKIINPDIVAKNFADDIAAAAGNVAIGEDYHTDGIKKVRII